MKELQEWSPGCSPSGRKASTGSSFRPTPRPAVRPTMGPYASNSAARRARAQQDPRDIVAKHRNMRGSCAPSSRLGLPRPHRAGVEKRLAEKKVDKRALARSSWLTAARTRWSSWTSSAPSSRHGRLGRGTSRTTLFDYEAQEPRARRMPGRASHRKKKPVYWCMVDRTASPRPRSSTRAPPRPSSWPSRRQALGRISSALEGRKVAFAI